MSQKIKTVKHVKLIKNLVSKNGIVILKGFKQKIRQKKVLLHEKQNYIFQVPIV